MRRVLEPVIFVFVSICLTSLGINLIVAANIGSDPLTVLQQGVSRFFGLPLWLAVMIVNVTLLALALLAGRRYLGWATIVDPVGVSMVVAVFHEMVATLGIQDQNYLIRILTMLLAQVLFSFAYALLIESHCGSHAMDVVIQTLTTKFGLKYPILRYAFDVLTLLIGGVLGGTAGLGTALSLLTQGYLVVLSRRFIKSFKKMTTTAE